MNSLRQPHAHTLKLACAYTHLHIHTHVHLHTLTHTLTHTRIYTYVHSRLLQRLMGGPGRSFICSRSHSTAGAGMELLPKLTVPKLRTTRDTSVSGCVNSEWSLFATSQQLMPEQATNWVHPWAFMSLEQVSQLHRLREKHRQFSGQAELCWHSTGQWGNQYGLARTCHLIVPEEQGPNISTENQITPSLLERKQDW